MKKADAEMLMSSDERLRLLEDNVRDFAIIELASDGRIAHWNLGAERILGYQEAEIVGRSISVIFTPEDRASGADVQELKGAIATGRAEDERWHLKKDGSRFWASGIMTGLRDDQGNLRGFAKILRDQTEHKRATEELAAVRERERRAAEVLQRSLLMGRPVEALIGLEVSTQYEPASDDLLVGGDFFDAFALKNNKAALVLGDVMGKGLGAAARTAQVKFALRLLLRETADPAQALTRLNAFLCQSERLDNPASAAEFVVLCVAVFDSATGSLSLCAAGTEPPLIIRASGEQEQIKAGGQPLAIFDGAEYTATELQIGHGDVVLLATDGITEARQGDTFLGYEGMCCLAQQSLSLGSLELAGKAIVEGARLFAGGTLGDDVCLLLARRQ